MQLVEVVGHEVGPLDPEVAFCRPVLLVVAKDGLEFFEVVPSFVLFRVSPLPG